MYRIYKRMNIDLQKEKMRENSLKKGGEREKRERDRERGRGRERDRDIKTETTWN